MLHNTDCGSRHSLLVAIIENIVQNESGSCISVSFHTPRPSPSIVGSLLKDLPVNPSNVASYAIVINA